LRLRDHGPLPAHPDGGHLRLRQPGGRRPARRAHPGRAAHPGHDRRRRPGRRRRGTSSTPEPARPLRGAHMTLEIKRLHLASLQGPGGGTWPVHGFVVTHPGGAVLVDTGVVGPQDVLDDWRVVNRSVADALAELDMSPADIGLVINTHLHFDHCGQNAVFKHAPFYVQRAELDRARKENSITNQWFDFAGAKYELLDGDAEIAEGVRAVATPGHTVGHQSVIVESDEG